MNREQKLELMRKYYRESPYVVWRSSLDSTSLLSYPNGIELFWNDKIYRVGHGDGDGPDGFQSQTRKHILDECFTVMVPQSEEIRQRRADELEAMLKAAKTVKGAGEVVEA